MQISNPYIREAGTGPGVVCIHANASSWAQWRDLMDLLSENHRVLAPDSYGSGKSPNWQSDREIALQDEVNFFEPAFALARSPFTLVGHSYGAAVAVIAALANLGLIRALAMYEPTLFALVDGQSPAPNGVDGIRNAVFAAGAALDVEDRDGAAEHFIDFWMGTGSWAATPSERKPSITESMANVRRWSHALFTEPTRVAAFAALEIPVLYMLGGSSPESAHAVALVLLPVLRSARVVEFAGLLHMAPITHPQVINAEIPKFLKEPEA